MSDEQMRAWINIVTEVPVGDGRQLSYLTFNGLWSKIVTYLTALAIILGGLGAFIQGIDAGRNFACNIHWLTDVCPPPL